MVMKMLRCVIGLATAIVLFVVPAHADQDVPPASNDTIASAKEISLPFSERVDTSTAVDGADDMDSCFDESAGSVWYRFTPAEDMIAMFSTLDSHFDTVIDVYTAEDGRNVACDDDGGYYVFSRVRVDVLAGKEYLIRVAGYSSDHVGRLAFRAEQFIPMEADISIAEQGQYRVEDGHAVIDAVIACNQDAYVDIAFHGSHLLLGSGVTRELTECGEATTLSVPIDSRYGHFAPGPVEVRWNGYVCNWGYYYDGWEAEPAHPDADTDERHEWYDGGCTEVTGEDSVLLVPSQ